jgi:exodeoxyribonuclease VII small subunit
VAKKKRVVKESADAPSFEDSLGELEAIVGELESGQLGLSDALARYEEGVKHLKSCHSLLVRAERKIELLSGVDADGQPITEPFDEAEHGTLDEKAAARGKRRTRDAGPSLRARTDSQGDVDDDQRLF